MTPHCFHETDRSTFTAGNERAVTVTETCCFCAAVRTRRTDYVSATTYGHGPHANRRYVGNPGPPTIGDGEPCPARTEAAHAAPPGT